MATTETSKLRTLAGVVGIGSLALFGATACDDGGAETEDPAVEDPATEEEPMEEDTMEEDTMEEDEDM
ncbi:hypothetical protein I2485_01785 [Nesterenkonia sp. E16_7]|uniref:hypothetical protein n=1 Tax=unclassified Nesterenkonia TaxID=2629769 RepID=UPI001A92D77E|nr:MULTISPECIES: hypothetical protein [unclassified Nesterenkonia]MBO0596393.1 hypothetical protein [Nesterenkonia sp. E16_10]MBO0597379.1 hypothetical protein [Nesterenkonia sp. E16_7]